VGNLDKLGIKQLVCLHDECYGSFKSLTPAYGVQVPFKLAHYFEYLHSKLKVPQDSISPLNIKCWQPAKMGQF